jgi:hypothetical protein
MDPEEDDSWIEDNLPLCDEWGYPVLTDANGDMILDDFGEPVRTGFGSMQIEPVDVALSHTEFVIKTLSW